MATMNSILLRIIITTVALCAPVSASTVGYDYDSFPHDTFTAQASHDAAEITGRGQIRADDTFGEVLKIPKGITSVGDVLTNPKLLAGKTTAELETIIGLAPGWKVETLGKGAHADEGWVLREYSPQGNPTGRMIRWHPGAGHHGSSPYWRVTSGEYGKSDIIR